MTIEDARRELEEFWNDKDIVYPAIKKVVKRFNKSVNITYNK